MKYLVLALMTCTACAFGEGFMEGGGTGSGDILRDAGRAAREVAGQAFPWLETVIGAGGGILGVLGIGKARKTMRARRDAKAGTSSAG